MKSCKPPDQTAWTAGRAGPPTDRHLSARLRALPDGRPLTVAGLARELGSRVHGLALLVLVLPEILPVPLPSLAAVLALPLIAISLHLMWHGEDGTLPGWIGRYCLAPRLVALARTRLADLAARAERLSRPRWPGIAGRERAIGAACLILSVILLLPVPLFNMPPAICLALLAWGLVQRDGVVVALGVMGMLAVLGLLATGTAELVRRLAGI